MARGSGNRSTLTSRVSNSLFSRDSCCGGEDADGSSRWWQSKWPERYQGRRRKAVAARNNVGPEPAHARFELPWTLFCVSSSAAMDITKFVASSREAALLLGTHDSYRAQLTRRLAALRKKLGHTTRGAKYTAPPPITADQIGTNIECDALWRALASSDAFQTDSFTSSFWLPSELGPMPWP